MPAPSVDVYRRPFLRAVGIVAAGALAGCTDRSGDGSSTPTGDGSSAPTGDGPPTPTRDPSRVTTTAGEAVTIRSAAIEFPEDGGPWVRYRLRNEGSTDATVAVRTVLTLDGGDSYEGRAFADVPAGGEVVVEYRVVEYSVLPDVAAEDVRRGHGTYEVYLNGEQRGAL